MKRFCRLLLVPAALGALLTACHSDSKPAAVATPPAAPGAPAAAPLASAGGSPGAAYQIYRGRLPGAPDSLTLHLLTTARLVSAAAQSVFATYAGADGHPYRLVGRRTADPDSLVLEDISPEKQAAGSSQGPLWRLRRQGAALVGTYRGQPLRLREARPAGALAVRANLRRLHRGVSRQEKIALGPNRVPGRGAHRWPEGAYRQRIAPAERRQSARPPRAAARPNLGPPAPAV
ncbi:hypothetical protein [Hymenobacter sp. PAMC 26628]|uniref:hypothetical protein n=1 Tax=Hymenobacter sp. PAMC 26628 TaxID=1484118 RepID=UPI0012FFB748